MDKVERVWLIGNIETKDISSIRTDLARYGYHEVNIYIPTIKKLSKTHRGRKLFDEVPMVLNFGFFSIPLENVLNREYLKELRVKVQGIRFWVKDVCNPQYYHGIASVDDEEVIDMMKTQSDMSLFNEDVFDKINVGKQITLKGYPYEGIIAEITDSNRKKGTIKVRVEVNSLKLELDVQPENVFYSVYSDIDPNESMRENYLEDSFTYTVDEIFAKVI